MARAVDPRGGVPALVEFLNLAKIKKLMDGWYDEHFQDEVRERNTRMLRLTHQEPDPASKRRVRDGFARLSTYLHTGEMTSMGKTPEVAEQTEYDSASDKVSS